MKPAHATWISLALVVASFLIAAALNSHLPDPVPTRWDVTGVPERFTPKPWGAYVPALLLAGLALVLDALPRFAPRGYEMAAILGVYTFLRTAILSAVFLIINGLLLWAAF